MDQKISIVLLDDDRTSNFINKRILSKALPTAEINDFLTGEETVHFLLNAKETSHNIDLIILDINMPEMDGWEFIVELRAKSLLQFGKLVILSSSINEEDIEAIKKYPEISGFLLKPLDATVVMDYLPQI